MNVRLKHEIHFTAGVYYHDLMAMNNYRVTLWMATNSTDSADQGTAFERIKYFIYSQMESTIFIDQAEEDQCQRLVNAGLNITTMPGQPVDQLIGIMLYYKLNAITEDRMIILETEISSALGEDMTYLHSDYETTSGYDQPEWWTSPDLVHSDFVQPDPENIVTMPGHTGWSDLDLSWTPVEQDTTGNIVVFADFKKPNDTD
jgi:hypothetical protein